MKPKSTLRAFLLAAGGSLLAVSSASALTYTWNLRATGSQDWETVGNWAGGTKFVSGSGNELAFSIDAKTPTNITGTQTITNVPTALSMNTLTLGGTGPNDTNNLAVIVGTSASTWTIGDGTISTVNLNSALGGGAPERELKYTIAANLVLNGGTGGITTFTGNSPVAAGAVFSGNITETSSGKGITKSGSSLLIFSGNNSYTGTTLVSAGTLRLNSANALSGGLGVTGGTSALTINGTGVVELGAGNFQRNLGTGSSQFQMTAGGTNTSGFSARGGARIISVNNDASQELVWGSSFFNPGKLLLNAATANNSLELTNKIDLNAATRTVVVNADKALLSGVIRTASGTAGLTKEGAGMLVLTGNNTYNGTTTLTGGTLSVGAASNFGSAASTLNMNGGTLQITGTTLTSISGLGHTVALSGATAKGFDIHNPAHTFTVDQVVNGSTFTKSGAGTLVFNQNNTLTGATTVNGGGTLVLDYSTNNGSKIGNAALNLNGGNLVLRGGSGGKAVTSISIGTGTGNTISRDGSSTATIANTGAVTVGFLGNLLIAEAGIVSTTTANVNGIVPFGNITIGSDFATNASGLLQAYSGYTPRTAGGAAGTTTVVSHLTGGGTMTGSLTSYALKISNSTANDVLTLGANNLTVDNNGSTVLYAGGASDTYTINATSGAVRPSSTNQSMTVNTVAGTLIVNATLTAGGNAGLSKAGAGTLVAGGASTYVFGTNVQQGVLRAANANALGTTAGGVFVQSGAALELSQTTALTPADITIGAEALSITGTGISNQGALRNHSGNNTYQGAITIGAAGARINANASSSLTLTGGIATTVTQDVTFGGAGNTTVSTAAISGSGGLIKDGAGTTTLSAANSYAGPTNVNNGTILINGSTSSTSLVTVAANATLGGSGTVNGHTTISGIHSPGNSPGIITHGGNLTYETSASVKWELIANSTGSRGTNFDGINVGGVLDFNGTTTLNLNFQFGSSLVEWQDTFWASSHTGTSGWLVYSGATSLDGFGNLGLNAPAQWLDESGDTLASIRSGASFGLSQDGNNIYLTYTVVPEPRAALLGGLGLLMLLRHRRCPWRSCSGSL